MRKSWKNSRRNEWKQKNLQQEWMLPETLQSGLSSKGEAHLREVKEAWLEPNEEVSVLKLPSEKPILKKDMRPFG